MGLTIQLMVLCLIVIGTNGLLEHGCKRTCYDYNDQEYCCQGQCAGCDVNPPCNNTTPDPPKPKWTCCPMDTRSVDDCSEPRHSRSISYPTPTPPPQPIQLCNNSQECPSGQLCCRDACLGNTICKDASDNCPHKTRGY